MEPRLQKEKNQIIIFYHFPCLDGSYCLLSTFFFLKLLYEDNETPLKE